MNYYIITGTSRGLGEALAKELSKQNNHLFCISRKKNEYLIESAQKNGCIITYFEYDLNDINNIEHLIHDIFTSIDQENIGSICLINNAGVVNPIRPIGKCENQDMIKNININTIAPMILSNEFIRQVQNINCEKTIVNISSGAGKKPYFGWGSYCSSKAAIDMFTKCLGVEQEERDYPVKVISFSPGIIDTDMQQEIRLSNTEDFTQIERFKKFKEDGLLRQPSFVAQKVIEVINNKDLETGVLIDIKEML